MTTPALAYLLRRPPPVDMTLPRRRHEMRDDTDDSEIYAATSEWMRAHPEGGMSRAIADAIGVSRFDFGAAVEGMIAAGICHRGRNCLLPGRKPETRP